MLLLLLLLRLRLRLLLLLWLLVADAGVGVLWPGAQQQLLAGADSLPTHRSNNMC
jgi:hypothetical protein